MGDHQMFLGHSLRLAPALYLVCTDKNKFDVWRLKLQYYNKTLLKRQARNQTQTQILEEYLGEYFFGR